MNIQLVLLALLLIIGAYEIITLSFQPKPEKSMPLHWKKSTSVFKNFEGESKNNSHRNL